MSRRKMNRVIAGRYANRWPQFTAVITQNADEATTAGVGAPDVSYSAGPWKLAPHEALVVDGVFPDGCAFANVLLLNKYLLTKERPVQPDTLAAVQMPDFRTILVAGPSTPFWIR